MNKIWVGIVEDILHVVFASLMMRGIMTSEDVSSAMANMSVLVPAFGNAVVLFVSIVKKVGTVRVSADKVVAPVILAAFLLLGANDARAQTKQPDIFGLSKFMQSPLVQALQNWTDTDINGALSLSTSIPELQDVTGQACWQTMLPIGKIVKAHPLPLTLKLATDIQAARMFLKAIKAVCVKPECTQVFSDISNQAAAFAPIPVGASLSVICAKIP
jgi:hypothetical protein